MNKRAAIAVLATLTACVGRSPPPAARPTPVSSAPHTSATPEARPPDRPAERGGLPGCDQGAEQLLRWHLDEAGHDAYRIRIEGKPDPIRVLVDNIWRSPCLAHVARFLTPPYVGDGGSTHEIRNWDGELISALSASVGGFSIDSGRRVLYAPPAYGVPLSPAERSALGNFLCPDGVTACGHAQTFVARAQRAFDAREAKRAAHNAEHDYQDCDWVTNGPIGPGTPFDQWVDCINFVLPLTYRYPDLRWRAPTRGWLILRGPSNIDSHPYELAVRAYDLATGAAYLVRSVVPVRGLAGPHESCRVADAGDLQLEGITGNVAVDGVRELAFVLGTATAPRPIRVPAYRIPVPDGLSLDVTPRRADAPFPDLQEHGYRSEEQAEVAFSLVDDGHTLASGNFTRPDSWNAIEDHADKLLADVEGGLERGCARAPLPRRLGHGTQNSVICVGPRGEQLIPLMTVLDRALERLRATRCSSSR
jgi:hypothetical protein